MNTTSTLEAQVATPSVIAKVPTFTRIGDKKRVNEMARKARKAGYVVESTGGMGLTSIVLCKVTDPTNGNALVFKAVQIRPSMWATTYSTTYFQEPADMPVSGK